MSGTKEPYRYRFSLSGPRFQLAYIAAFGNGMCSIAFLEWVRARAGLVSTREISVVPILLSVLFLSVFMTAFFLLAWWFTRKRFAGDPDLGECWWLLLLVYAVSVPVLFFTALAFAATEGSLGFNETSLLVCLLSWIFVSVLVTVPFATRAPRHGFFCAAFILFAGAGTLYTVEGGGRPGLDIIVARMAIVFLYFAGGIRAQKMIAIAMGPVALCSPGIQGAVVGTIIWAIRRKRARQREAEAVEGRTFSTDETDRTDTEGEAWDRE